MAKYDTYTLTLHVGALQDNIDLSVTIIFEDGDNEQEVMAEVREKVRTEAIAMKGTKFLNDIRQ